MRGTRKCPHPLVWTIASGAEVDEGDPTAEPHFLERETHLREVELRRDMLTVYERYRSAFRNVSTILRHRDVKFRLGQPRLLEAG